jgi:2-phosphoglycerate kinase
MADLEVARMQVSKNMPAPDHVPARMMTKESMQKDFDYEMAQKITRNLLDEGLISIDEYDRISELNARKFSPFYGDLMDI